ncbi:MAG: hypothetical protein KatS3mg010_1559 [Acidimicrobiia bacterium]|nr:MAG: hypothetical protein KatS3mg010_1559 [Acidimicrobiia bacterium]
MTFETATGVLRIVGEANTGPPGTTDGALGPAPPRAAVEDLTRRVLAAVVDEWDVEVSGGRIRFCCARRIPIRR